jgi:hypothetical protein
MGIELGAGSQVAMILERGAFATLLELDSAIARNPSDGNEEIRLRPVDSLPGQVAHQHACPYRSLKTEYGAGRR